MQRRSRWRDRSWSHKSQVKLRHLVRKIENVNLVGFSTMVLEDDRPVKTILLLKGIDSPVEISSALSFFRIYHWIAVITPKVITASLAPGSCSSSWRRHLKTRLGITLFVVSTTTSHRDWTIKGNFMVLSRERTDLWQTEFVSKWPFDVSENSAKLSAARTWMGDVRINSYMTDRT